MKFLLIAGGRNFEDREIFESVVSETIGNAEEVTIVQGGAPGADKLAREYAISHGLECAEFPADWQKYGKAAGPKRNDQMTAFVASKGGIGLFFWDGQSRGTRHCIKSARKAKITFTIWDTNRNCFMDLP